jgi:hypothetical protein
MEYTSYRDGGTKSFKNNWFCAYFKTKNAEVCLDHRILSETYGEWYLGHPDKGRLLTQEEKDYVVPEIIKSVEADVTWRNHYLEQIKNPQKR